MSAFLFVSSFTGCSEKDGKMFGNRLYINMTKSSDELLFEESLETIVEERTLTIGVPHPAEREIRGTFVADPSLIDKYRSVYYNPDAIVLPEGMCTIEEPEAVILESSVESSPVTVRFEGIEKLDRSNVYVMPVALRNVTGIDVVESKTIMYYVFKGASLINVVADISKNYFRVNWKSDVKSLKTITVEALVRVSDWGNVEGQKSEEMSTLFGIEGNFLVRMGDQGFPNNQIQLVNPNGNFPNGNVELGLPVDEWVHIAVVWDATTGDRIIYHNGEPVASDSKAKGSVNLSGGNNGCFIGRAWNNERWLNGNISELRVWSVQRTPEEIATYMYKVAPESDGLIAYWKFNEGAGEDIRDYTGHGNDVKAANELTWNKVSLPE